MLPLQRMLLETLRTVEARCSPDYPGQPVSWSLNGYQGQEQETLVKTRSPEVSLVGSIHGSCALRCHDWQLLSRLEPGFL